jgi:RNA recognition motif-containing protein
MKLSKKLYVGNLSFQTTEDDLKGLFAQAGEVESVRIITDRDTGRSRGFGFVEMGDDNAEKAVAQFNGTELKGRALTVNEARPLVRKDFVSRDAGQRRRSRRY